MLVKKISSIVNEIALLIFFEKVNCCLKSEIARTPGVIGLNIRQKYDRGYLNSLIHYSLLIKQRSILKVSFCIVFTEQSRQILYWPSVQYIYS